MNNLAVISFSFASHWLRDWQKFSTVFTECSKARSMQSKFAFKSHPSVICDNMKSWAQTQEMSYSWKLNNKALLINNSLDFNRIHGLPVALCFLQPSLVRDLMNCLKGVHQSQSVYLIKILAEYFLNSTHQSVARMAERLICKKLEICIDGQKMVNHAFYSVQSLKTLCSKVLASKNIWATKNSSYIKLKCSPLQLACI